MDIKSKQQISIVFGERDLISILFNLNDSLIWSFLLGKCHAKTYK